MMIRAESPAFGVFDVVRFDSKVIEKQREQTGKQIYALHLE
jgi:hypothetical protein